MLLEGLAAIGAVAALAVAVRARPGTLVAAAVFTACGLSLATSVTALLGDGRVHGWWSLFESLALLGLVFLALRRGPARGGAMAALLAAAAAMAIIPSHATATGSVLENAAAMAVWGFGALIAAGAARYLDALDVRRARSVADARREQRLSLARDLHDFVAHDMSAIVVQAQAAQVVGARKPREALAALERIEHAGLHALSAMDRAVEALRDAAPSSAPPDDGQRTGYADLRALAARFQATGSIPVDVHMDVHDDALPPEVASTAQRLVTEALTNVRRHAPAATRVEIRVARAPSGDEPAITVSVANDGVAAPRTEAGALNGRGRRGGFGLVALGEHLEALEGTLRAGPDHQGGWRLTARLPLRSSEEIRG